MEELVELMVWIEDSIFNIKMHPKSFDKWGTNPNVLIIINMIHAHKARVGINEVSILSWIIRLGHKTIALSAICLPFL